MDVIIPAPIRRSPAVINPAFPRPYAIVAVSSYKNHVIGHYTQTYQNAIIFPTRRGARVDDRGGLENRCSSCGCRGFDSLPLRLFPPQTPPFFPRVV